MGEFSLRDLLIPELLKNKIDFKILNYENGDPGKPITLDVLYEHHYICKVDCVTERTPCSPSCYQVAWYSFSKHMPRYNLSQYYARSVNLVHDIRKVIDFIFSERGNGKTYNWRNEYQKERDKFDIKDVIFNSPATIVFWSDGTKTVVKAENEIFDPEKGLAMAIAKKALGNNYGYYDVFKKYVGKHWKKQKKGGK